jgi:hypothetical protein
MSSKKFYTDPELQKNREKLLDEMSNSLHKDANKADRQFKWVAVIAVILLLGGLIYFFI